MSEEFASDAVIVSIADERERRAVRAYTSDRVFDGTRPLSPALAARLRRKPSYPEKVEAAKISILHAVGLSRVLDLAPLPGVDQDDGA